jgi:hypothetical protein
LEILIQSNDNFAGVILSKEGIRDTENPGKADIESLQLYHFPLEQNTNVNMDGNTCTLSPLLIHKHHLFHAI